MTTKSGKCCNTHQGPHWLYVDFLDRERHLQHLEHAARCAGSRSWRQFEMALHTYMQEDQARLKEKRSNMERENTFNGESKEYPYSLLGIDERVEQLEQRRRALWSMMESVVAIPVAS